MSTQQRSAERRAHLFREISREIQRPNSRTSSRLSRSSRSQSSAVDNTLTSEEQEQFLPALVAPQTPPKVPEQNQNQQINTSAARRAFPGFSEPGSPESPSIEYGRTGIDSGRSSPSNLSGSTDPSESYHFDFPDGTSYKLNWDKYNEMLGRKKQPKTRDRNSKSQVKSSTNADAPFDKENQDPAKSTRYGSSRSASDECKDSRYKGANMKATVESDDESIRQPTITFPPRSTKPSANKAGTNVTPKGQRTSQHIIPSTTFTATSFNGSVALPDVPNITELITGQNLDGTPIYPRTAKILAQHGIGPTGRNALHYEVEGVEVPTDEKALYTSLAVLQRRVDELELVRENYDKDMEAKDKMLAEKDKQLKDLESKHRRVRSKLEERETLERKDSAVDLRASKTGNWEEERLEFEQTVKKLENRLHKANERTLQNELTISKLINDKQTADQQLIDANTNVKELTEESNAIHASLVKTQEDFAKQTHQYEEKMNKLIQQDDELRGKIQRRQKAVDQMSSLARELYETRQQVSDRVATRDVERTPIENIYKSKQRSKSAERRSTAQLQDPSLEAEPVSNIRLSKRHSVGSVPARTTNLAPLSSVPERDFSKDSDFLSFMEGDEVAKLRDIVERDRAALAEHQWQQHNDREEEVNKSTGFDDIAGSSTRRLRRQARAREREQQLADARDNVLRETRNKIIDKSRNESMPLKPSLKKQPEQIKDEEDDTMLTRSTQNPRQQIVRDDRPLTVDLTDMKEDTQTSIATSTRRRSRNVEDETSQLFLDDITMSTNQFGLPSLPRRTHMVPRAIPASEGQSFSKPSRSPGVSLAILLQGFKDELARMEDCKARYEAKLREKKNVFSRPALVECRQISFKITQLIDAIHMRSYHISTLYDVLEGQKEADQLMDEDEVEVTLQSLGIYPVEWEGLSD